MPKLLAVGAALVVAVLVFIWHETRAQVDAAPGTSASAIAVHAPTPVEPAPPAVAPKVVAAAPVAAPPTAEDGKVNANSDEFFDRFVERQPKIVSRAAMTCYRGHHLGMDQWLRFSFVGHIRHGEVTFTDVTTKESRLDDAALESCMLHAVGDAHYHDDSLPDVDSYPDEVTLNPERGGKKYMHDSDRE